MRLSFKILLVGCIGLGLTWSESSKFSFAQENLARKDASARFSGPTESGYLLPNGWHITPVGKHIPTNDLVLNIVPLADNVHALATCDGFNEHYLGLFDIEKGQLIAKEPVYQSWFGLTVDEAKGRVWWAGGGAGFVHRFELKGESLIRTSTREPDLKSLKPAELIALRDGLKADNAFRSGVCYDSKQDVIYSLLINAGKLAVFPATLSGSDSEPAKDASAISSATKTVELGGRPYDVKLSRDRRMLYVSDWSEGTIRVVDTELLRVVSTIRVGEHPNQIALHPEDSRLFVACASSNTVCVIDTRLGTVIETIHTTLFPSAPEGSTPTALAISPNGKTLYVANADNNCVATIDIETPRKSAVVGFIPTGWYPTSLAVTPNGKRLLVGVGKGNQSKANPIPKVEPDESTLTDTEKEVRKIIPYPYIGTLMSGSLSIIDIPDVEQLKQYTEKVYTNCPYSDKLLTATKPTDPNPIPQKVGDPSPIKHVIYVIKENRTYDQIFGDLADGPNPKGNGDPTLCMFPRSVTPNHHKLAEEFVLLDNTYCNGQVSRDGHPWSTMAYNTDYVARDWHLTYSRRLGVEDTVDGELSNAPSGHIWDACLRAGVSYRSYKEYGARVSDESGNMRMEGRVPGLVGHMCPKYGVGKPGVRERDMDLVEVMLEEYRDFIAKGTMPQFIIMSLGEDHTDGTSPGSFTPQACVGSNDQALGKLVEAVSNGPLWGKTAIFVIEDDAQNGPDHVDAHRTVSLVISPYAKRKYVDSTQYSTVSLIRTMELILGLQPLSQYDAAATPMFNSFVATPDLTPYTREEPRIDLMSKNDALTYGARRSMEMDFTEYDRIDDFELNEILWHAVMGADAPTPPAVRRAIAFRSVRDKRE